MTSWRGITASRASAGPVSSPGCVNRPGGLEGRRFFPLISAGVSGTSRAMTDKDSILAGNAAFYEAFAAADLARMSAIWADDGISCIHPGWPVLVGRQAVLESYRTILSNPNQDQIEHRNVTMMISESEGRVFCVEIVGGMALAATNWFKRIDGTWRLVHHQASPIAALAEDTLPPPPATRLN